MNNESLTGEETTRVEDKGGDYLRRYRTEIPNLVEEMDLTVYEYRIYGRLKRVAGDSGVCHQGTRGLAKATGVSQPSVVRALKGLKEKGLIRRSPGSRDDHAECISIVNIWELNFARFAPSNLFDGAGDNDALEGDSDRIRGDTTRIGGDSVVEHKNKQVPSTSTPPISPPGVKVEEARSSPMIEKCVALLMDTPGYEKTEERTKEYLSTLKEDFPDEDAAEICREFRAWHMAGNSSKNHLARLRAFFKRRRDHPEEPPQPREDRFSRPRRRVPEVDPASNSEEARQRRMEGPLAQIAFRKQRS